MTLKKSFHLVCGMEILKAIKSFLPPTPPHRYNVDDSFLSKCLSKAVS